MRRCSRTYASLKKAGECILEWPDVVGCSGVGGGFVDGGGGGEVGVQERA